MALRPKYAQESSSTVKWTLMKASTFHFCLRALISVAWSATGVCVDVYAYKCVFVSTHTIINWLKLFVRSRDSRHVHPHLWHTHTSLWFHPQSSCTSPLHPSKRSISDSCPHRLLRPWGSLLWDMACHCLSGSVPHSPDTRTHTPSIYCFAL